MNFRPVSIQKILGTMTFAVQLSSCVTTKTISSQSSAYTVFCRENGEVATSQVAVVDCTFTNPTGVSTKLNVDYVTFSDDETLLTVGQLRRLDSLEDSSKQVLYGLLLVGASAIAGRQGGATGTGSVVVLSTLPSTKSPNGVAATTSESYKPEHFLGGSFELNPQEMSIRSAPVKLSNKGTFPENIQLCFVQPVTECLEVPIQPWPGRARLRPR